jgi:hypothetical protein
MKAQPPLTVRDVVALTGLSTRTVIRLFEHQAGVFVLERAERPGKQRYRTFRIPLHVYTRVMATLIRVRAARRRKAKRARN